MWREQHSLLSNKALLFPLGFSPACFLLSLSCFAVKNSTSRLRRFLRQSVVKNFQAPARASSNAPTKAKNLASPSRTKHSGSRINWRAEWLKVQTHNFFQMSLLANILCFLRNLCQVTNRSKCTAQKIGRFRSSHWNHYEV